MEGNYSARRAENYLQCFWVSKFWKEILLVGTSGRKFFGAEKKTIGYLMAMAWHCIFVRLQIMIVQKKWNYNPSARQKHESALKNRLLCVIGNRFLDGYLPKVGSPTVDKAIFKNVISENHKNRSISGLRASLMLKLCEFTVLMSTLKPGNMSF